MKIFTAFLAHETNSFSPIPTSLGNFEELGIYRPSIGSPVNRIDLTKGASHFYDEAQRRGDDVFVGLCALAQPSRPTIRADYEALRDWMLEDLKAAGDVDIVLLMLHGSMMAEGYDDCEGDILSHIRKAVGPNVVIGALLDLHCNITTEMLDSANIVKACKEYPHTDFDERARELYELCVQVRKGETSPTVGFIRVPMLGLYQTSLPPMRGFIDSIIEREKAPNVLSITLGHGFPWSDFSDAGSSVIVITDGNQQQADQIAYDIGAEFFALRESGQAKLSTVSDAITDAIAVKKGTVIVADMADNPGGGAASDSTFILREMLKQGVTNAAIAYIWDPAVVNLAFAAGEGASLPLRIGGKVGRFSGNPVDIEATVERLRSDATQPHIADGISTPLGRTAVISTQGIEIVLNDIRQQPFNPEGLVSAGIAPWEKQILVLKSTHHFYAAFHQDAAKIIYCDAPGTLNSNTNERPYKYLHRPIWPLDNIDPFTSPKITTAQ